MRGKTLRQKAYSASNKGVSFPKMIAQGLAEWLATGEDEHLERVSNELLRWADGGGLASVVPDDDKMQYIDPLWYLREILTAPIIVFEAARQQGTLAGAELERVRVWLANAMKMTDRGGVENDGSWYQWDSHVKIHRGFVFILWGAVSGDDVYFQKGIQEYFEQLQRLRGDGSTYYDVSPEKGPRSLLKQNQVAAFLVMSAEIAANQGYDLYGLKKYTGVGVHDAIRFLLDATDNQALATRYSGAKRHNMRYVSTKPSNASNNLAWAEPYIARFWGTELADRLNRYVSRHRPAVGVTYGGNLTCMFAYF